MADGQIEADGSNLLEDIANLFAGEFLRYCALPPEEAVAALHRLCITLADRNHSHPANMMQQDFYRRITVAGDVLDTGAKFIGIGDSFYRTVIPDSKQNPAACGVGKCHQFAGE